MGFTEILLIGVVSLVVIGPERLPDVARTVGQWIGKLQRFVRGVKSDISRELDSGELKQLIGDQREQIDELRKMVRSTARDIESTTHEAVRGARKKLDEMEEAVEEVDAEVEADEGVTASPKRIAPPVGATPGGSGAAASSRAATGSSSSATNGPSAGTEAGNESGLRPETVPPEMPPATPPPPSSRTDPEDGEPVDEPARSGTGTGGA